MSEKQVALVGLGSRAAAYRDALQELPELDLIAVIEPEPQRRMRARAEGLCVFASVSEMLDAGLRPVLSIVCSPPATRLEISELLLLTGSDLLIEPPLSPIPAEAEHLRATAHRLGRTLVDAAPWRLARPVACARRLIDAGRIGGLVRVECAFSRKLDPDQSWRGDPSVSGGGVWMEKGPRALDLLTGLLGEPRRIRMLEGRREQGCDVEDEVRVETDHDGGVRGLARLSWNRSAGEPIARCVGSEGQLLLGQAQSVLSTEAGDAVVGGGFDEGEALVRVLRDFLDRRLHRTAGPGDEPAAWIHAGYRSLTSARWESPAG